jgi:hypothetical protein
MLIWLAAAVTIWLPVSLTAGIFVGRAARLRDLEVPTTSPAVYGAGSTARSAPCRTSPRSRVRSGSPASRCCSCKQHVPSSRSCGGRSPGIARSMRA